MKSLLKRSIKLFAVLFLFTYNHFIYAQKTFLTNPICPGYYADPTIIKDKNVFYIYATIDPWGGNDLGVFETKDFIKFKRKYLNWPTKKACTSNTSNHSMVWAPSIVKATNGKFYMYVAVGSELWAGVSNDPLGPWKNAKKDNTPLVKGNAYPGVHNIDPDCFIDEDGQAYLYWGSGFEWINGHCMAVKLKIDMISFDGNPTDITPPNYFEAPHLMKRNKFYYLMYSSGKAIDASYQVRYSVSENPLGPWTEGKYDPILSTSPDSSTIGPGHNTTFKEKDQWFILYHRIHPQKKEFVLRELCLSTLDFDEQGNILKVHPADSIPASKYFRRQWLSDQHGGSAKK